MNNTFEALLKVCNANGPIVAADFNVGVGEIFSVERACAPANVDVTAVISILLKKIPQLFHLLKIVYKKATFSIMTLNSK